MVANLLEASRHVALHVKMAIFLRVVHRAPDALPVVPSPRVRAHHVLLGHPCNDLADLRHRAQRLVVQERMPVLVEDDQDEPSSSAAP